MKSKPIIVSLMLFVIKLTLHAQGTFVYDQQSSSDETPWPYGAGVDIQQATPYGQTFVPLLSGVGFIRLNLNDEIPGNGLGIVLFLNLRSNSINGNLLSATAPVALNDGFSGPVNFLFSSEIPVTPGATYNFELVIQSGGLWNASASGYNYPNGTAFYQGLPLPGSDLWFREGIIVPEPSSVALAVLGMGSLALASRLKGPAPKSRNKICSSDPQETT